MGNIPWHNFKLIWSNYPIKLHPPPRCIDVHCLHLENLLVFLLVDEFLGLLKLKDSICLLDFLQSGSCPRVWAAPRWAFRSLVIWDDSGEWWSHTKAGHSVYSEQLMLMCLRRKENRTVCLSYNEELKTINMCLLYGTNRINYQKSPHSTSWCILISQVFATRTYLCGQAE